MNLLEICSNIKKKKELKDIKDSLVLSLVESYLKENNINSDVKNFEKTKNYKVMFKEIRKKLRKSYGSFKEYYEPRKKEVYEKIFEITGSPKSILDLGCGLTPLDLKLNNYYAYDISSENIKKISEYFKKNNLKSKAELFDLINDNYEKLPKVHVCFLLKVLESLEAIKKNISLEILNKIKADFIVVSFAKKVLSNNQIIKKKGRRWFKRILKYNFKNYETFDTDDEVFYIIRLVF
ncbi:hypothetical protein J4405_03160 [Candidatus Woesearchaeota archaeon]|nr:hypothetical protein [Candidatus Woesearchaeota archaeon]